MLMYSVLDTIKFETSGRFKKTDDRLFQTIGIFIWKRPEVSNAQPSDCSTTVRDRGADNCGKGKLCGEGIIITLSVEGTEFEKQANEILALSEKLEEKIAGLNNFIVTT